MCIHHIIPCAIPVGVVPQMQYPVVTSHPLGIESDLSVLLSVLNVVQVVCILCPLLCF